METLAKLWAQVEKETGGVKVPSVLDEKPARKVTQKKDSAGTFINVGDRVAFNYSGDVALGTVTKIASDIIIERDKNFGGTNPISRVKNGRSVLIIETKENLEALGLVPLSQVDEQNNALSKAVQQIGALEIQRLALFEIIKDAFSVDEIKIWIEEVYGKEVLEDNEPRPDWLPE